jgi:hypothetical protein
MSIDFIEYPDLVHGESGRKLSIMALDENEMGQPRFLTYDVKSGAIAWMDLEDVRVDVSSACTHDKPTKMLFDLLTDEKVIASITRLLEAGNTKRVVYQHPTVVGVGLPSVTVTPT